MSLSTLISRRPWFIGLTFVVLGGLALHISLRAYFDRCDRQAWAEACAEADRLDPGWRWEDLAANQPTIPAGRNNAEYVAVVARVLPKRSVQDNAKFQFRLRSTPPQYRIDAGFAAEIMAALAANPARSEIARLADCPAGAIRLPAGSPVDSFVDLPRGFDADHVAQDILYPRLVLLAEEGDADAALDQARIILTVSLPPAAFPAERHNLAASGMRSLAADGVERALAQGEPSVGILESVRRTAETESVRPTYLPGFRGARAGIECIVRAVDDGTIARDDARVGLFADRRIWLGWEWADRQLGRLTGADFRRSNATAMLRYYSRLIEWLKESPDGLKLHEREYQALYGNSPPGAAQGNGHLLKTTDGVQTDARLRCAVVALAAEQFRRESGRWPATLDELVPKYLTCIPTDPFDLKPLKLARRPDGIVIYSVGGNAADDGGAITTDGVSRPSDVGIRLWDVDKRRQPPRP